jgi:putative flippase GtrA
MSGIAFSQRRTATWQTDSDRAGTRAAAKPFSTAVRPPEPHDPAGRPQGALSNIWHLSPRRLAMGSHNLPREAGSRSRATLAILRFAIVAGLGWLIDASLLLATVRLAGAPPGPANMLSSLTAAVFVYLVAHERVHGGQPNLVPLRLGLYVAYTIGLVTLVSFLLALIVPSLEAQLPAGLALLTAKVLVTPPQFLCNFLVSRRLAMQPIERLT